MRSGSAQRSSTLETARRQPRLRRRLDRGGHDTGGLAVRMIEMDPDAPPGRTTAVAHPTLWFVQPQAVRGAEQADVRPPSSGGEWRSYYVVQRGLCGGPRGGGRAPGERRWSRTTTSRYPPPAAHADGRTCHRALQPHPVGDAVRLPPCCPTTLPRGAVGGILGADRAGFLTPALGVAFAACCERRVGAEVDREPLTNRQAARTGRTVTRIGVHGLGVDRDSCASARSQPDVEARLAALRARRRPSGVVRVDRTELSKNIVRGLLAYADLLRTHPEWRGPGRPPRLRLP